MRNLIILVLLLLAGPTSFAEDFKTAPLMSSAFRVFDSQSGKENTLPFLFTVPSDYEKREISAQQTVLWGTKEDIETIATSRSYAKIKRGVFTLISQRMGYDRTAKKFWAEDQMKSTKNTPGYSNVVFYRTEIQGYPMATLTAIKDGRHFFMHYIAVGKDTLVITYSPPETSSERDSKIWSRFINGLIVQN